MQSQLGAVNVLAQQLWLMSDPHCRSCVRGLLEGGHGMRRSGCGEHTPHSVSYTRVLRHQDNKLIVYAP